MPIRTSYDPNSSLAPLSEIIDLEPEQEPWCAGYAPSQGRRCHARTNAHGRRSATMLLNEGTKDLRAGRSIDALLEDLAPHVLCTRFHQAQASDLTRRWKRQVRQYLDSQVGYTPSPRRVRMPSRADSSETAEANAARIVVLEQRLLEAMEKVRRLEVAQQGLSITANPPPHGQGRSTNAFGSSSSARRTPNHITSPRNVVQTTPRNESRESVVWPAISVARPARVQVIHEAPAVNVLAPRSDSRPSVVRTSSSTERENSQNEGSQTRRRPIEGECGICLCELHIPQQEVHGDEEDESENSDSDDDNDIDEDDDEDDNDEIDSVSAEQTEAGDEAQPQDEELVWCKARCGNNFHKRCIDQWLATDHASTCPACRSRWRD